jgi:hypothetical protein
MLHASLQGDINMDTWQQFIPSLLLVLTAFVYVPLTLYDIIMHVSERTSSGARTTVRICQCYAKAFELNDCGLGGKKHCTSTGMCLPAPSWSFFTHHCCPSHLAACVCCCVTAPAAGCR